MSAVIESGGESTGHYSRLVLPNPSDDRPFVYINMVTSADGKVTVEGSERGLGSRGDQRLMQELRAHADAVINGAGTLRQSGTSSRIKDNALLDQRRERGQAPLPLAVVVSRLGHIPLTGTFFTATDFAGLVILSEAAGPEQIAAIRATGREVAIVPDRLDNGTNIVRLLRRDHGVRYLLCEGGPSLNAALFRARVVDEIFLTLAPKIVGGRDNLTAVEGDAYGRNSMPGLRLKQCFYDSTTDELFLRYAVAYPAAT